MSVTFPCPVDTLLRRMWATCGRERGYLPIQREKTIHIKGKTKKKPLAYRC
jgi:hypothetical protein